MNNYLQNYIHEYSTLILRGPWQGSNMCIKTRIRHACGSVHFSTLTVDWSNVEGQLAMGKCKRQMHRDNYICKTKYLNLLSGTSKKAIVKQLTMKY